MDNLFFVHQFLAIWRWDFMQHALEAGTIVAVVAGAVGYFVVIRRSSFAAHALAHAGFAGAAGAVLVGLNPIVGLLAFTMGGGALMGALGKRAEGRDAQVGTVLAFMLGLGLLFISLYRGYATLAYSILFGEILGISQANVIVTLISGIVILVVLAVLYRPLLFSSLDEAVAEAKGLPVFAMGIGFMLVIAIATSIAVQVVGVLLIFAMMITPAAVAERLARTPAQGIALSIAVAVVATWTGLILAFYYKPPASFFITTIVFLIYAATRVFGSGKPAVRKQATHHHHHHD